jgi:hypothetical protein
MSVVQPEMSVYILLFGFMKLKIKMIHVFLFTHTFHCVVQRISHNTTCNQHLPYFFTDCIMNLDDFIDMTPLGEGTVMDYKTFTKSFSNSQTKSTCTY